MNRTSGSGIVAGAVLALGLCTAAFAASFTGLGHLPGGEVSSLGAAVSADGSVVVGWSGYEAFRWTSAEGMEALGDLPGGDFHSRAPAVSADGSVVVGWGLSDSGFEAFRWTATEGMMGLGDLPGGGFRSLAQVVSADGSVVVGRSESSAFYAAQAYRWTAADGMVGLGTLPGGRYSEALAVSADGTVVVGQSQTAAGYEAFRWSAAEGMVALEPWPAGPTSSARAVSADGSVVAGQVGSGAACEAFRWTATEGLVRLGVLPGQQSSRALGISADGSVVVGASGRLAFVWDRTHGMRSLRSLLAEEYDLGLDGWSLEEATAISLDGRTLVGNGTNPSGQPEAWIASLDAPRDSQVGAAPAAFALEGNYPNPFNPGTSIHFALPEAAVVRLVVYDVGGQAVATLIDGQPYGAGHHAMTFAAAGLASGVYLYRLEAGRFQQVERMTLVK